MEKDWWKGKVAYQIYPKSFKDSNGDGVIDDLGNAVKDGVDDVEKGVDNVRDGVRDMTDDATDQTPDKTTDKNVNDATK